MARPVSPGTGETVNSQDPLEQQMTLDQQRQALADARLRAVQPTQKGLRAWQQAQEIQRVCQVDFYAAMRLQERFGATVGQTDDSLEKPS